MSKYIYYVYTVAIVAQDGRNAEKSRQTSTTFTTKEAGKHERYVRLKWQYSRGMGEKCFTYVLRRRILVSQEVCPT